MRARTALRFLLAAALLAGGPRAVAQSLPLTPEQVTLQVRAVFSQMRNSVPKDDRFSLAAIDAMEAKTEASFEQTMARFPKRPVYAVDVSYVTGSFKQIVLPRLKRTAEIMDDPDLSESERRSKLAQLAKRDEAAVIAFDKGFNSTNAEDISEANQARVPANVEWAEGRSQMNMADFINYSPIITASMYGVEGAFSPGRSGAGASDADVGTGLGGATGVGIQTAADILAPAGLKDESQDALRAAKAAELGRGGPGLTKLQPGMTAGKTATTPAPTWLPALSAIGEGAPRMTSQQSGVALQSGRYGDAERMARTALEFDPKDQNALFVLASAKGRVNALGASTASRSAAAAGASALKPVPADPGPGGAASPAQAPAPVHAAPPSDAVAGTIPVSAATRTALAEAKTALNLGDDGAALALLDKALQKDPASPALLALRAQTYGRLGRWEEALRDADKALASMPGNMPLLITKALAENRTGRWREALATSERIISADPSSAWGYASRAHAWGGLGNREAMMSDIQRAASLDPSFAAAAEQAALLQLPTDLDVLFLFPGEKGAPAAAPAPASGRRARDFGLVTVGAVAGGLLLALALLSLVLVRLKESAGSLFTRASQVEPAAPAAAAPRSAPAGLIRGQYALSRQIGAGGMGMVYEGTDRSLGRRVAIKKMREELRVNARDRDRFVIEAKTVASLHHPNIVDIYAIAEEGEDVYLVFEFVEGKTVHELIQSSGRLGLPEAVSVTRSMGEALAYAHSRGVIHRDMKPSNAMLSSDGVIKVMDFGIARMAKDAATRYSMTNNVVGTPPYMAPEQEQGVVRKESDVYALAVCSYEMLTGKLPFIGHAAGMLMNKINMSYIPPSRAIAGLPEALDEVFVKAFQADPDQRYRTPLEFVAALAAATGGARSPKA